MAKRRENRQPSRRLRSCAGGLFIGASVCVASRAAIVNRCGLCLQIGVTYAVGAPAPGASVYSIDELEMAGYA